ncbi:MAG: ATPase, T2SS/T4P/T4SS family, partial [Planctomycetota bacterium]|nr:ATPase, T2SS/T4P/T4SS family [Planctomycetota bacterium]
MSLLDMDKIKIDPLWALRIPEQLARRRNVLPFAMIDDTVHVACLNPNDSATLQAVQRHIKKPIQTEVVEPQSLKRALSRLYATASSDRSSGNNDLAVGLCDELLKAAILRQASDIHIDPGQTEITVRFRVDGRLEPYRPIPIAAYGGLLSRFKVLSNMDIAEKRSPQDGRFRYEYGQPVQSVELRVATLPTKYGERMTLRLLALQTESLTLERLGLSEKDLEQFDGALRKAHGLVLVTGPTGSGKSTTLYAGLRRLLQRELVNIITIEDPIEYDIDGVAQVEVDSADKVSFSKALRSIL